MARGLTQKTLSEKVNTTLNYYKKLESGERTLDLDWINKFASALDIEPYQLIAGSPDIGPAELALLDIFRQLDEAGKQWLLETLRRAASDQ